MNIVSNLCSTGNFMPHGYCYLWQPDLVALHVISDSLITLAYTIIPFTLLYFIRKRKDLPFNWIFACFGLFIIFCGATHAMEIITLWKPLYWVSGLLKAATGIISIIIAILLIRLIPFALAIPSPAMLAQANTDLKTANEALKTTLIELERSNEELARFAYVASHDLQEPLRMVSSYTQLLERKYKDQLDEDANQFIHFAVDGAKRMQQLITDLLAYSNIAANSQIFDEIDCNQLLQQVIENLKIAIEETQAKIIYENLPIVKGDKIKLLQLFQNLISNAIKFRGAAAPEIIIQTRLIEHYWQFSIQDNGIGIEPQFFDKIFVMFQRLHGKQTYPGTGIGLAICKKIVEQHHGEIWVRSLLNKGTTFYFTLPA